VIRHYLREAAAIQEGLDEVARQRAALQERLDELGQNRASSGKAGKSGRQRK
jgi:hypothetical protein